jgi:hypothetical protein
MPYFLVDVPWNICQELHFVHVGASAPFILVSCRYLNRKFPGRSIGRGGPIALPPHSPDINPLDFYLRGLLKLYPQQLALTSPTGGGRSVGIVRSRTKTTELVGWLVYSSPTDDVETPKSNSGRFSNNVQHASNLGLSAGGNEMSNSGRRWAYGTFTLRSCEELSVLDRP